MVPEFPGLLYHLYKERTSMLYPLKLTAPLKDYLWGGMRLKEEYNKQTNLEN